MKYHNGYIYTCNKDGELLSVDGDDCPRNCRCENCKPHRCDDCGEDLTEDETYFPFGRDDVPLCAKHCIEDVVYHFDAYGD